jgi:hypothetical protein
MLHPGYPVTVTQRATHVSLFLSHVVTGHKFRSFSLPFISDHLYSLEEALLQFLLPNIARFKHQTKIVTASTASFHDLAYPASTLEVLE